MNVKKPRPVQQVVAADNRGCEHGSSDAGQRAVAADAREGIPEPLESPARVEALVANLEAAFSILIEAEGNFQIGRKARGIVCVECATVMLKKGIADVRRGLATGGNVAHERQDERVKTEPKN